MPIYMCPSCHCRSLAWDSRSKAFLCSNRSCNEAIFPPESDAPGNPMALAITTGRVVVTQQWLDQQGASSATRPSFAS